MPFFHGNPYRVAGVCLEQPDEADRRESMSPGAYGTDSQGFSHQVSKGETSRNKVIQGNETYAFEKRT